MARYMARTGLGFSSLGEAKNLQRLSTSELMVAPPETICDQSVLAFCSLNQETHIHLPSQLFGALLFYRAAQFLRVRLLCFASPGVSVPNARGGGPRLRLAARSLSGGVRPRRGYRV